MTTEISAPSIKINSIPVDILPDSVVFTKNYGKDNPTVDFIISGSDDKASIDAVMNASPRDIFEFEYGDGIIHSFIIHSIHRTFNVNVHVILVPI